MGSNSRYKYSSPIWHQKYPFLIFLTVFILGILLHKSVFSGIPEYILWISLLASLTLVLVFHYLRSTHKAIYNSRIIMLGVSFFMLGNIADFYNEIRNNKLWYGHFLNQAEALHVRIVGLPQQKEKTILLPVVIDGAYLQDKLVPTVGEIKLYLYVTEDLNQLKPGNTLIIPNKVIAIKDSDNPFGFKYAEYLKNNNIFHQIFLGKQEIFINNAKYNKPTLPEKLRQQLLLSIHKNIKDSTTQSLVKATLLNDRSSLDSDLRQAYSTTGIAHIIAISGMHVSILFGVILLLLQWIKNKKLEWLKYFVAIPLVWLYIVITNYPPSAVRAAVMFTLLAFSIKLNRKTEGANLLIIAAFVLLFYNTNWIYDTGVQLSFSAVLSIFTFFQPIRKLWTPKYKILTYFWNIVAVSLAAQVLVVPLVLYYFHQFPVWVVIANIPAAIYSVLLMSGALIIFLLDALNIPSFWIGDILIILTDYFHSIIYFLSDYTPKVMQQFYLSKWDFWIFLIAIILISSFLLSKRNYFLFSGLGAAVLLLISFILQDWHAIKQNKLVVYNISGHSIIDYIEGKQHKTIFVDGVGINSKNYQFNLFPAQLGLRAMGNLKKDISNDFWIINKKRILVFSKNYKQKTKEHFPIDYLILNEESPFDLEFWHATFQPRIIILDGSIPRWKAQQWKKTIQEEAGLPVHWVQEDGAWVWGE